MGLRLITPPAVEPVSLIEAKADLRVEHSNDNDRISRHIASAREWLEERLQRKIAVQTWDYVIDEFPIAEIKLPFGPVQSIDQIAYDDVLGVEQIIDDDDYYLDDASRDKWVFPVDAWPPTLDGINAVRVRFVAGNIPADVPTPLKEAIRLKVQELYEGGDNDRSIRDLCTNYLRIAG